MRARLSQALRAAIAGRRVWIALTLLVAIFGTLGALVRYSSLGDEDVRITRAIQSVSDPTLDGVMLGLSFLGSWGTIPILAPLVAAGLAWRGLKRGAVFVLLSLLGIPIDTTLKLIWARARPDAEVVHVVVAQSGYSFPSGHAVLGTAFYGTLAVLAWIHLVDRPGRWPVTLLLAGLPPFIDLSRIYLGAHWLSDVIAGSAVGLAIVLLTSRWYAAGVRADAQEAGRR